MNDKTAKQSEIAPEPTIYKQLYAFLYAYRTGTINFLELLDAFEVILQIPTSQQNDAA